MAAAVSQQKCRLDVPGRYIYYDPALGALIEDAASGLRHCGVQLFGSHYLNRNRLEVRACQVHLSFAAANWRRGTAASSNNMHLWRQLHAPQCPRPSQSESTWRISLYLLLLLLNGRRACGCYP